MNSKLFRSLIIFSFLFIFVANLTLEARHSRRRDVYVINQQQYVTPTPIYYQEPVIVEQHYYTQPIYTAPAQTVVYRQAPVVYREQVIVRERQSPASFFTSFALGLGFGLLAR